MKLDVIKLDGKAAGSIDLGDDIFGLEPRVDILHRVVRWQRNNAQAGTHKVKTRRETSYSTKKIYRQKDQKFIDLLNRVRVNKLADGDLDLLNSTYDPYFTENNQEYIILATHNRIVDETNRRKLQELDSPKLILRQKLPENFLIKSCLRMLLWNLKKAPK